MRHLIASLFLLSGAEKRPFDARDLRVDVLRLGAEVGAFEARYPKTLCDRDPIDQRTRTVWFHAPRPCRDADPLPNATILVLYTRSKAPSDPVEAIAWFGNWPHTGGNFPLDVGIKPSAAEPTLGPAKRLFDFAGIVDGGDQIVVSQHGANVYTIARKGVVFGYVAGAMSAERDREEWRGLISNVLRYAR